MAATNNPKTKRKMLDIYDDIMTYTKTHNFIFICTDGKVIVQKEMLVYYVPYMNTLLSAEMKKSSKNHITVAFSSDDIKYMIWFSITKLFLMEGEIDEKDITWDRWNHRFEILDYFFQGDDDIKQSIGKIIKMSISEDGVDMTTLSRLIKWEFDVTPYSDKIARLIFDSRAFGIDSCPFDLEFTRSILSIPFLAQNVLDQLLNILASSRGIDGAPLIEFLLTSDIDLDMNFMNFITTLIKWEFDVTPYSDKIAQLIFDQVLSPAYIYDHCPRDLEFTRYILSIPFLAQNVLDPLLNMLASPRGMDRGFPLIKFLLTSDINLDFHELPLWRRIEIIIKPKNKRVITILSGNFDSFMKNEYGIGK